MVNTTVKNHLHNKYLLNTYSSSPPFQSKFYKLTPESLNIDSYLLISLQGIWIKAVKYQ